MQDLTLYIGSKNLSSWSLRPWLLLRHHGCAFREVVIALDQPDTRARILEHSPSGRVPLMVHGEIRVWESIAICEYVAETLHLPHAWPADAAQRATARAVAQEMHGGFAALRRELPFDATRDPLAKQVSEEAMADIARICAIWRGVRSTDTGNGWLFGDFGIVDAMFAPVAMRLHAYAVPIDADARRYVDRVLAHPAIEQWIEAAAMELPGSPPTGSVPPAPPKKTARRAPQQPTKVRSIILPSD